MKIEADSPPLKLRRAKKEVRKMNMSEMLGYIPEESDAGVLHSGSDATTESAPPAPTGPVYTGGTTG